MSYDQAQDDFNSKLKRNILNKPATYLETSQSFFANKTPKNNKNHSEARSPDQLRSTVGSNFYTQRVSRGNLYQLNQSGFTEGHQKSKNNNKNNDTDIHYNGEYFKSDNFDENFNSPVKNFNNKPTTQNRKNMSRTVAAGFPFIQKSDEIEHITKERSEGLKSSMKTHRKTVSYIDHKYNSPDNPNKFSKTLSQFRASPSMYSHRSVVKKQCDLQKQSQLQQMQSMNNFMINLSKKKMFDNTENQFIDQAQQEIETIKKSGDKIIESEEPSRVSQQSFGKIVSKNFTKEPDKDVKDFANQVYCRSSNYKRKRILMMSYEKGKASEFQGLVIKNGNGKQEKKLTRYGHMSNATHVISLDYDY